MLSRLAARFDQTVRARSLAWTRRTLWTGLALAVTVAGCLPSDFDALTKRDDDAKDPCADASSESSKKCPRDANVPEAGEDAASEDAASEDAATEDASPEEAGSAEAGPSDEAGMMDGSPPAMCSGECEPGSEETDTQPCGACKTGSQMRKRTCSSESCTWSSWANVGTCTGVTAPCAEGDKSPCENGDSCGQRVCSAQCKWSACQPKKADGCLRIRKGQTVEGSNYRCCGTAGHWQFCMPECTWSTECKACTEGEPNFCSDCYP